MLRILHLNRDLAFHGGVSNVLLTLARGNDRARAQLWFGSLMEPSTEMHQAFGQLGYETRCFGDDGYRRPARRLRAFAKEKQIDVIVAASFRASAVAKLATVGTNCRVAHYVHAVDLVLEGRFKPAMFAWMAKHDPFISVSKTVEMAHRPANHKCLAAVVYNGVKDPSESPDTAPYPRAFRSQLGIPADALLLCYIGVFVGWKDHLTVLRAFQKLDRSLNAHLLLIGEGKPDSEALKFIVEMNDPRVHVVPPRPDARRVLGCVDIYVHSSRREGFGLAVVEAMLAGCPVVATREGAFTEYIEDGRTGLLAAPGDADSFAAKIEQLARDRALAQQIAAAGREMSLSRFSPATFAKQMCDFLIQATGRQPAPAETVAPRTAGVEYVDRRE
jgi:glycosyltransferase involved in cell wall biosynthesis